MAPILTARITFPERERVNERKPVQKRKRRRKKGKGREEEEDERVEEEGRR